MKNALIPVGMFTLTLLATTTWSVMKTPLPEMPVDEIALADSLLADSLWRDSVTTAHGPGGDDKNSAIDDEVHDETPPAVDLLGLAEHGDDAGEPAAIAAPTPAQTRAAYQSLARIFARMKPAEAAEVLLHMSNEEVEGVVRNLGARQAASVLANLPEQRAAELARRLLNPSPGGDE